MATHSLQYAGMPKHNRPLKVQCHTFITNTIPQGCCKRLSLYYGESGHSQLRRSLYKLYFYNLPNGLPTDTAYSMYAGVFYLSWNIASRDSRPWSWKIIRRLKGLIQADKALLSLQTMAPAGIHHCCTQTRKMLKYRHGIRWISLNNERNYHFLPLYA